MPEEFNTPPNGGDEDWCPIEMGPTAYEVVGGMRKCCRCGKRWPHRRRSPARYHEVRAGLSRLAANPPGSPAS